MSKEEKIRESGKQAGIHSQFLSDHVHDEMSYEAGFIAGATSSAAMEYWGPIGFADYIADKSKHSWFVFNHALKSWYDPISSKHLTSAELYEQFKNKK